VGISKDGDRLETAGEMSFFARAVSVVIERWSTVKAAPIARLLATSLMGPEAALGEPGQRRQLSGQNRYYTWD
jgi:hypothetical protein